MRSKLGTPDRPSEAQRYEALYRDKAYPHGCPERVMIWAGCSPAVRILDMGCGRATLHRIFWRYTGFDFTLAGAPKNPLYPGQSFHLADLTGPKSFLTMPEIVQSEYDVAVCNDVMEHLPPEDVEEALRNIAQVNARRFIFSIACTASRWGDEHGGLHLTIQPPEWWRERLVSCIGEITRAETFGASAFFEILKP